jgi:hypothetical protein
MENLDYNPQHDQYPQAEEKGSWVTWRKKINWWYPVDSPRVVFWATVVVAALGLGAQWLFL